MPYVGISFSGKRECLLLVDVNTAVTPMTVWMCLTLRSHDCQFRQIPFVGIAFGGKRERLLLKTVNAAVTPCTMIYLTSRSMRSNASQHAHSCNDTNCVV